jgi:hypothetical protein
MLASRILPALLLVAGLALPAGAQVFDVFPYELVSAFGRPLARRSLTSFRTSS